MSTNEANSQYQYIRGALSCLMFPAIVLAASAMAGCRTTPGEGGADGSASRLRQTYQIGYLKQDQCETLLRPFNLTRIAYTPQGEGGSLVVEGTPDQLTAAKAVLDLADVQEEYCAENLGPASKVRTLPSNSRIASALYKVRIGTFAEPPGKDAGSGAIIDVYGDSIWAFLPVRCRARLLATLLNDIDARPPRMVTKDAGGSDNGLPSMPEVLSPASSQGTPQTGDTTDAGVREAGRPDIPGPSASTEPPAPSVVTLAEMGAAPDPNARQRIAGQSPDPGRDGNEPPRTVTINLSPAPKRAPDAPSPTPSDKAVPANGEDRLTMTLPESITLIQLLDLVGKHVGLNYVYDPKEINNQPISLKLHGTLQGEMKVKDLYTLLETVLQFMNLAMVRQKENLVAIVPMEKALQTQPDLVEGDSDAVQVGDSVVTRVFDIQNVDVAGVMNLLQSMKLAVAATPLDNTNLLLVTCHAGRMNRIEQLVGMIDRPGQPTECRFRRLSYVRATPLIARIRSLGGELKGVSVATPSPAAKPSGPAAAVARPAVAAPPEPMDRRAVYLDTDERTNRILMVGFAEELTLLEQLIDVLDVAQEDPRSPRIYTLKHVNAQEAVEKLQKLEVLKGTTSGAPASDGGAAGQSLTGEPLVAVLETTNQLVVQAAADQHEKIRQFIEYIDVAATDPRTIAAYQIRHIDAYKAKEALEELDLVSVDSKASSFIAGPNQPPGPSRTALPIARPSGTGSRKAPIVVSESTNALLIKATPEQHTRIAAILNYIDRYTPEEQWTYQVYPLESSSPDHLASLLERLIQDTTRDKDGKIEKVTPKIDQQISIVPDPNTFSVIVYASRKSQKWIEGLIARLDKRRPQVLIDVTLVEVTRTDTFEYDLSLVGAANGAAAGNLVIDPIQTADSGSRLEGGFNLLDQDGNPTGRTRAFYSDRHVQALLSAMARKNYGRVLAKPKVLVDDGRKGQISTTDTTTYVKESIQIPQTGTPITTREFVPIEANIELNITPHISEGNLLRLDVFMSRDDFGTRPLSGAPPDKATSEVTTTVFVPDNRTVILGGLVKLNQSKGGSKVPFLGDVPLVGVLFRSINNNDVEKKLYVFLKANIVRPYDDSGLLDLQEISQEHQDAFEESESQFQNHESVPGVAPEPMPPENVLRDYK
ncbi:MAG: secretin N-terminal domain-containing protein [Phycisphaerales bacterium]